MTAAHLAAASAERAAGIAEEVAGLLRLGRHEDARRRASAAVGHLDQIPRILAGPHPDQLVLPFSRGSR